MPDSPKIRSSAGFKGSAAGALLSVRIWPLSSRLHDLLQAPNPAADRIERLVAMDPVLCAQVLRHCSDPPFAASQQPVTTLGAALARLGNQPLLQMCSAPSAHLGNWQAVGSSSLLGKLLEHSIATATAGQLLARALCPDQEQEAYLGGLLHDLGRFWMLARYGRVYAEFAESTDASVTSERQRFGFDHARIGEQIAEAWNLAPPLLSIIASHHDVKSTLEHAIALGERLASCAGFGFGRTVHALIDAEKELDGLGVPRPIQGQILPEVFEALRLAARTLGAGFSAPGDLAAVLHSNASEVFHAHSPPLSAARMVKILRTADGLDNETDLCRWMREVVMTHTLFERVFVFLHSEADDLLHDVNSDVDGWFLTPAQLHAIGLDGRGRSYIRLKGRELPARQLLGQFRAEDLMVVGLKAAPNSPLLGALCADRLYTDAPVERSDLFFVELVVRHVAQSIERRRLLNRLEAYRDDAERDYLTGIYNRRFTIRLLEREILKSRRTAESLVLILLDIDNFKAFNDLYGHLAGDVVLREVARLVSETARTSDIVGRFGGEEFLVVLPDTSIENGYVFAERLRIVVEDYGRLKLTQFPERPPTISIGISTVIPQKDSPEDAIDRVDRALYASKKAGRNRVCLGLPEQDKP